MESRLRDDTKLLLGIEAKFPEEAVAALENFTAINWHYRGANWSDCLEVLMDSDSHLDVTEPQPDRESAYIAVTLLYARKQVPSLLEVQRYVEQYRATV